MLCTGIQVISPLLPGGPSAKVGSSAKSCVLVFKSSLLYYLGGPLAKICSSAKSCILVFKSSLLYYLGGSSAKVGSSPKFCVLVFKSSLSSTTQGAICQIMFIRQVLCTGVQGIYAVFGGSSAKVGLFAKFVYWYSSHLSPVTQGGSIGQSRFVCHVCVLVFKSSLLYDPGGPFAKVDSSAKFCVLVFKSSLPCYPGGFHWPK